MARSLYASFIFTLSHHSEMPIYAVHLLPSLNGKVQKLCMPEQNPPAASAIHEVPSTTMLFPTILTTGFVILAALCGVHAEKHVVQFENKCGHGTVCVRHLQRCGWITDASIRCHSQSSSAKAAQYSQMAGSTLTRASSSALSRTFRRATAAPTVKVASTSRPR